MMCRSFRVRRLEIGQEPDLLQDGPGELLRLVDDQHGPARGVGRPAGSGGARQPGLRCPTSLPATDPELVADRGQELGNGHPGIEDQRHIDVGRNLFEQTPAEGRLPVPTSPGELDESSVLLDPIDQVGRGPRGAGRSCTGIAGPGNGERERLQSKYEVYIAPPQPTGRWCPVERGPRRLTRRFASLIEGVYRRTLETHGRPVGKSGGNPLGSDRAPS